MICMQCKYFCFEKSLICMIATYLTKFLHSQCMIDNGKYSFCRPNFDVLLLSNIHIVSVSSKSNIIYFCHDDRYRTIVTLNNNCKRIDQIVINLIQRRIISNNRCNMQIRNERIKLTLESFGNGLF